MANLDENKYIKEGSRYYTFAGYPSIKIYKKQTGSSWSEHLLFGDFILIRDLEIENGRVKVKCRNSNGWARVSDLQKERVLEVNFVDIGQGDGCHVVTPNDQHIIIDAGEFDNMNRYLTWRFYLYNKTSPLPFPFKVVISHSDKDHYKGFDSVFGNDKIRVSEIFHNGIVERPGDSHPFGRVENGLITSLVKDTPQMLQIITNPDKRKGTNSTYPKVLYKALKYNPGVDFKMALSEDKFLGEFDESCEMNGKPFQIKILAPIVESRDGEAGLRSINNLGKDKNGHSVLLKLVYGKCRILLGGDINEEFGELIVKHLEDENATGELQVDAAKSCHHGSNHFYHGLLAAINSPVTVISSGDDENYCHPRPDAIGALGKSGYGEKPLIFSTEIARSNKEITRKSMQQVSELFTENVNLEKLKIELKNAGIQLTEDQVHKYNSRIVENNKKINSYLTKYGMINLRTDGFKMIVAQKLERKAAYGKWDIHQLEYSETSGRFELTE